MSTEQLLILVANSILVSGELRGLMVPELCKDENEWAIDIARRRIAALSKIIIRPEDS